MFLTKRLFACFAAAVVVVWAVPANAADPALSFSFSDLVSGFDSGSMLFTAADNAGHVGPNDTSGDVTRLDPLGVAVFDGASATTSFFSLEMTISPKGDLDPANFLSGDGVLTITDTDTDTDGDTISSAISGIWINNGSAFFYGTIQDPAIASDDGEFNGTSGAVSLAGLTGPLPDDIFNIFTMTLGSWFTDGGGVFGAFSDAPTLAQGNVVPEPATLCLLAFGTLVMAGRWRRKA